MRWVVCLCADWCGLCRDYKTLFAHMAARYPALRFAWLDIEDQAELVGDLTPQANTLSRLLDSLQSGDLEQAPLAPAIRQLLDALQAAPEHWITSAGV